MKKLMMVVAVSVAAWCSWGAESISVDKVANHYPWDGKVDCIVTLSGTGGGSYKGAFELTVEKNGETVKRVVTNDLGTVDRTCTNTFDCTALFGPGYFPNGGIKVSLVKKLTGVQLWANGPYFAECNVGAPRPQDSGYYFWWGDTVGYKRNANNDGWVSVKDGASFTFVEGNCPTYNKSASTLRSEDWTDANGNLAAARDAATMQWGAPWRMMTDAELQKLVDTSYCTRTWTSNWKDTGVAGYVVTGAQSGYTDKSIFLPAAGYGYSSYLSGSGSYGYYWTSTPYSGDSNYAWFLYFFSGYFNRFNNYRYSGQSVRPLRGFAE